VCGFATAGWDWHRDLPVPQGPTMVDVGFNPRT
jgi:hypothetical protein